MFHKPSIFELGITQFRGAGVMTGHLLRNKKTTFEPQIRKLAEGVCFQLAFSFLDILSPKVSWYDGLSTCLLR